MLSDSTPVWDAMHALEGLERAAVPVVGARGEYRGVLYESSVIGAYLDVIEALRREEHAIG